MILYHIMADTGCLPDDVVPQIPTNRMKGEDQEIPRICLGQTAKPCRTRNFRIKSWISLRNGLTKPEKEAHQKLLHILANSIVLKLYDR